MNKSLRPILTFATFTFLVAFSFKATAQQQISEFENVYQGNTYIKALDSLSYEHLPEIKSDLATKLTEVSYTDADSPRTEIIIESKVKETEGTLDFEMLASSIQSPIQINITRYVNTDNVSKMDDDEIVSLILTTMRTFAQAEFSEEMRKSIDRDQTFPMAQAGDTKEIVLQRTLLSIPFLAPIGPKRLHFGVHKTDQSGISFFGYGLEKNIEPATWKTFIKTK